MQKVKEQKKQTNAHIKAFKQFLAERNLPSQIETMPLRYLISYLRLWFSQLTRKDGSLYSPSSLCCIRASVHRYLIQERNIELIGNKDFIEFNKAYEGAVAKSLKKRKVSLNEGDNCYPAIEKGDMEKLSTHFNRSSPQKLQDEVFFILMYHNGFQGREWFRDLD